MDSGLLDDPRAKSLSPSARRLLRRPRPLFRGVLHRWAALGSIPVAVLILFAADSGREAVAVIVFCLGATAMLGVSALVHARDWSIESVEVLVRLDHSAIFAMFATSATPIALLAMDGGRTEALLWFAWVGALIGVAAEWTPIHPPHGVMNAIFLVFGFGFLPFTPWLFDGLGVGQLVLLFGGGAAYAIGAVVVGARWPDPWTDTFGYHEIWHVFVVVGVATHYVLMLDLLG